MSRTISINCPAFDRLLISNREMSVVHLRLDSAINDHYHAHIIIKHKEDDISYNVNFLEDPNSLVLDYSTWLQEPVAIEIEVDSSPDSDSTDPSIRYIHGVITSANFLYMQGDFYYHQIVIQAPFSLAALTRNYRIYQNQTTEDILVSILKEFNQPYELYLDHRRDKPLRLPIRDFVVMFNESYFDLFKRLCSEWGLAFGFFHRKEGVILQISLGTFGIPQPNEAYKEVSYYPPDYKTTEEYLHDVRLFTNIVPTQYTIRDYDYHIPHLPYESQTYFAHPLADMMPFTVNMPDTYRERSEPMTKQYEVYEYTTHIAQPNAGAYTNDAYHKQWPPEMKKRSDWELECLQQNHFYAHATGHIRGLETGFIVSLKNYPNVTAIREWLVKSSRFEMTDIGQNSQNETPERAQRYEVHCEMTLSPLFARVSPPRIPSPKAHLQTAVVVGVDQDHAVHTDKYGRVKIQFHWDRYGTKDENSSCWVRVNQAWAGAASGATFMPRVGQEVLVDFIDACPNKPVVIGRVHNQMNPTPWAQTKNDGLSGIRSRELPHGNICGGRSNHLVFDDTADHIHTQLKSDHADSSISLGDIHRVEEHEGREEARGQGFELRTDDWGAVRAGKGLYQSTYKQSKGRGQTMDANEASLLLQEAKQLVKLLTELATQHDSTALSAEQPIQTMRDDIQSQTTDGDSPTGFNRPVMLHASPVGVGIVSQEAINIHAGQTLNMTTSSDMNIATGKSLLSSINERLSVMVKRDAKLTSAEGKMTFETHGNNMELLANHTIKMVSHLQRVEIAAKEELLLTCGDAYIRLKDGNIEIHAPGKIDVKGASHEFAGPESLNYHFQAYDPGNDRMFVVKDPDGNPVPNYRYRIKREDGLELFGETNEKGETLRVGTGKNRLKLTLLPDNR